MTPVEAVKALRKHRRESQQAFAARLGLSIRAITNYEAGRSPAGKALVQLRALAESSKRDDLATVFSEALHAELGSVINPQRPLDASILRALFGNRGRVWLRRELERLVKDAKSGLPLTYPEVYTDQRKPDQAFRLASLESLLVLLRLDELQDSAEKLLDVLAKERSRDTGVTYEKAYTEVLVAHPHLYELHLREKAHAAVGTQFQKSLAVPYLQQRQASKPRLKRRQKGAKK